MKAHTTTHLKAIVASLLLTTLLVGCQAAPSSSPEIEPIETAVAGRIFATLTTEAPSPTAISTPTATSTPVPYNIYFGDLHVHTSRIHTTAAFHEEFSRGVLRLANLHAREVMEHDFVAITNHARLLEDWMWEMTLEVANEFTEDGVFVSFPAFEWTASHGCGEHCSPAQPNYPDWGHRNVYFRNTEAATGLLRCTDPNYDTPEELFSALPAPDLATTIPHHTAAVRHPFDWSTVNADYDRLVEIVQRREDFEADILKNGWSAGHILGVVAGTDNHIAAPGWRQGVTAILSPELTRDALFDALLSRHTYATTHGDILLHFFGDGEMQGTVLSARKSVEFSGEIVSTSGGISLVELVDNGEVSAKWEPDQASSLRFETTAEVGEEPHFFYVRVTLDNGHQAWSSPIWANYLAPTPTPSAAP
ncbi:MAG TPA: DUF3604 domain-containing protein [Anaerolineae bacterium]|nr:DUF3604 domain-containing protein [Anaerolineae bacterium]